MKSNALYFPYINLPQSNWLYAMALYWDKISSIVPFEYVHSPEKLNPFMLELVREGLVQQIIPAQYLYDGEAFAGPFLQYVKTRLSRMPKTQVSAALEPVKIHIEKIGFIADELKKLGVLRQVEYPWYEAVHWVGVAFMVYLAACLGYDKSIDAQPVTNDAESYRVLGVTGRLHRPTTELRRIRAREIILQSVLPAPEGELDIGKIVRFKDTHGKILLRFREEIETVCHDLANRPAFDEGEVANRAERLRGTAEQIAGEMKTFWKMVVLKTVVPVFGAGFGLLAAPLSLGLTVSASVSLIGAITSYATLDSDRQKIMNNPLAYAALARRNF